jgi:hypothetical protein
MKSTVLSGWIEKAGLFTVTAAGRVLVVLLVVILLVAWIFSEPFFLMHDHFKRSVKLKTNPKNERTYIQE